MGVASSSSSVANASASRSPIPYADILADSKSDGDGGFRHRANASPPVPVCRQAFVNQLWRIPEGSLHSICGQFGIFGDDFVRKLATVLESYDNLVYGGSTWSLNALSFKLEAVRLEFIRMSSK